MHRDDGVRRHVLAMLSVAAVGCAPAFQRAGTDLSREATPIVIDESVKSLEDAEMRKRIAAIMASPEVRAAVESLTDDIASGTLSALEKKEIAARLDPLASAMVAALSRELGKGIEHDIAPAIRRAIAASLSDALSPEQQKAIASAVSSTSISVTRDVAKTLGAELLPALIKSLGTELQRPELRDKLAGATEEASKNVILGTASAVQEIQARSGAPTLRDRLSRALTAVVVVSALSGAVLVGLLAFTLSLRRRAKLYAERSARQDAIAEKFLSALQSLRGKRYADDLYRTFDAAIASGPGAEELRSALARAGASPLPRARRRRIARRSTPRRAQEHQESQPDRRSH